MKDLIQLYLVFMRISLTTIGGGYTILPIMEHEIVENKGWATREELLDYFAIGQCTPGLIAVNTATFIGNKRKGVLGGISATLGYATPSVAIILITASLLQGFENEPIVKNAFSGIRVAVFVLIAKAVMNMWKNSIIDITSFMIFSVVLLTSLLSDVTPIIPIILSALLGILIKYVRNKNSSKKRTIISPNIQEDGSKEEDNEDDLF